MKRLNKYLGVFLAGVILASYGMAVLPQHEAKAAYTWWNTNYQYRMRLSFDTSNITSNLTDYRSVIKVELNASNFNFSTANTSGQDVRFVANDDTTELRKYTISWNGTTGNATIAVRMTDTITGGKVFQEGIWMYWGNSSVSDNQSTLAQTAGTIDPNVLLYAPLWAVNTNNWTSADSFGAKINSGNATDLPQWTSQGNLFNGTSEFWDIIGFNAPTIFSGNFSILGRFNLGDTTNGRPIILAGNASTNKFAVLTSSNPWLVFGTHNGTYTDRGVNTGVNFAGTWHNFMTTLDALPTGGNTKEVYLDTTPSNGTTGGYGLSSNVNRIGWNASIFWKGYIGDVIIYKGVLNSANQTAIYEEMNWRHSNSILYGATQTKTSTVSTLPNPPLNTSNGTLLEGFENNGDWALSGNASVALVSDTTHVKQGTQSINMSATNGNNEMTKVISWDLSTIDSLSMDVWMTPTGYGITDNATNVYSFTVFLSPSVTLSPDFKSEVRAIYSLVPGWNKVTLLKSDFIAEGSPSWSSTMVRIAIRIDSEAAKTASLSFDNLRYNYKSPTRIMISFDDGHDSTINTAYPILQANGQKASSYIVPPLIGTAGYMSTTNLTTLFNAGWDIGGHSMNHSGPTLITENATALANDVNTPYTYISGLGLGGRGIVWSYPGGQFNQTVINAVSNAGYLTGRTSVPFVGNPEFDGTSQYELAGHDITNSTTVASVESNIDEAVATGRPYNLYFHSLVAGVPAATEYNTADFQSISDYLKQKQEQGLLIVETFTEYYQEQITSRTVSMDKDGTIVLGLNYLYGRDTNFGSSINFTGWFDYGSTVSYGNTTANVSYNTTGVKTNSITLTPGQTYHYRFNITDINGTSHGSDSTFTLTLPSVTTGTPTNVGMNGGTHATLNANITSMGVATDTYTSFQYSTDLSFNQSTPEVVQGAIGTYSATITGFLPNQFYNVRAVNRVGAVSTYGATQTFFTNATATFNLLDTTIILVVVALILFILSMIVLPAETPFIFRMILIAVATYFVLAILPGLQNILSALQ